MNSETLARSVNRDIINLPKLSSKGKEEHILLGTEGISLGSITFLISVISVCTVVSSFMKPLAKDDKGGESNGKGSTGYEKRAFHTYSPILLRKNPQTCYNCWLRNKKLKSNTKG